MNIDNVFEFIKNKRGYEYPFKYKLINGIPLSKDELNVKGDLDLYDMNYHTLPNDLTVKGDLLLADSSFRDIPNNLKVRGNLNLLRTPISYEYIDTKIKKMIKDKGGYVRGDIYT